MPLPQLLCENPDYLPPALPPKRQRANAKSINSLNTPPSSPKLCLNESIDENAEMSSQNLNNNNVHSKSSLTSDTLSGGSKPLTPVTPTTPSFAAIPSITPSKSANVPLVSHTSVSDNLLPKSPTAIKVSTPQSFEPHNHVGDIDVRTPIYSNDNRSTNSRSSNEHHYIHLYDGGNSRGGTGIGDRHKPNKNGIDNGSGSQMVKMDSESGAGAGSNSNTTTINSNSKIKNNNVNNNNNSNTSDNNERDDEGIVVLRHPTASMHLQKVRLNFYALL